MQVLGIAGTFEGIYPLGQTRFPNALNVRSGAPRRVSRSAGSGLQMGSHAWRLRLGPGNSFEGLRFWAQGFRVQGIAETQLLTATQSRNKLYYGRI